MKNAFMLILGVVLLCAPSYAQTADQEAIKKVCLAETEAFLNFDFDAWASYHVQSADEQLAWNNPDGTIGSESGWEKIGSGMKNWFQTAKKEDVKRTSDNFTFVIRGDMALVAFDVSSQGDDGKTIRMREYRTLLKISGQWKILAVQAFSDYPPGK